MSELICWVLAKAVFDLIKISEIQVQSFKTQILINGHR